MTNSIQYYITIIVHLLWIFLTILFLTCTNRNVPTTKGRHFYNSVTLSKEQMKIMSNLTVPRHTFHIPQKYISKHRHFMLTLYIIIYISNPPIHPWHQEYKESNSYCLKEKYHCSMKNKTKTKPKNAKYHSIVKYRIFWKKIKLWVYESIRMKGKLNCSLTKFNQDFKKYKRPNLWCLLTCFRLEEKVIRVYRTIFTVMFFLC